MWSSWEDIEQAKVKERGYYGIYQIQVVDKEESRIPIGRVGGVDEEGIIYIGRARPKETLAKRIRKFQSVAQYKNIAHHGAETYVLMRITLAFLGHAYENYKLQYRVTRLYMDSNDLEMNRQEMLKYKIEKEEVNALADYFCKYGELPPCNSNFPGKWNSFIERLQGLWGTSRQR